MRPSGPLITTFKPKDVIYQQHPLKKSRNPDEHPLAPSPARTLGNVCLVSCVRDPINDNVAN